VHPFCDGVCGPPGAGRECPIFKTHCDVSSRKPLKGLFQKYLIEQSCMQEVIDASASSVPAVRFDDFEPGVVPARASTWTKSAPMLSAVPKLVIQPAKKTCPKQNCDQDIMAPPNLVCNIARVFTWCAEQDERS